MTESKKYTISEMAKHFGVTTRTIRYYEEIGLLEFFMRRNTSRASMFSVPSQTVNA